ncbi:ABC transporter ATP-binding protein [Candidatus Symbiopectobacterium sp. NZEC127]|uniref:ATP-binding cassette domain-containing protein n=1 Tax=Candidatus Symbiopectobacterium sp. NZEC127 TaxID=2820472 RepID=UPI00222736B5|nr:ABC transporter ATP-binding protein [Candidatus Symbiopectobacterium sp. NZEC127]MCW2486850.1 ABC transporter ATP-binding protein [Candidatus Symbiopectobacterium sp. NZEC127]
MNDLVTAIKKQKIRFIMVLALILLVKISSTLPAIILGRIVDEFTFIGHENGYHTLAQYLVLFAFIGVFNAVFSPLQITFLTRFVQNTLCFFSINWIGEIFKKDFEIFSSLNIGKLIKSIERGILAYEKIITYFFSVLLPLIIELIILSAWLIKISNFYFLIFIFSFSSIYLYITHKIIKWRRRHIDQLNEIEDEQTGVLSNTLLAAKSIKLEQAYDSALKPLNAMLEEYAKSAIRVSFSGSLLVSAKILFLTITTSAIIVYGIMSGYFLSESITAGEFVSLFTLSTMLLNDFFSIAESYRVGDQFFSDKKSFEKVLSFRTFKGNKKRRIDLNKSGHSIVVKPFIYSRYGEVVLTIEDDVVINSKDKIAIIGPSGSGKTTFLELIVGVDKNKEGVKVFLDEILLDDIVEEDHLSVIRYAPQQPKFTVGPVKEAVFFGKVLPTNVKDYFSSLSIEYIWSGDKVIDHDANGISGGESKKLSILRILCNPGKFNFFDEPTSSVDTKGAEGIWHFLMQHLKQYAVICVTHDLSILNRFDKVIVIDKGKIVAHGAWDSISKHANVIDTLTRLEEENNVAS